MRPVAQLRRVLPLAAAALATIMSAAALATVRETRTFNPVNSNGVLNSPANVVQTPVLAGGYALGRIDLSGTLTSVNANTAASDARILITAPNGASTTFHPFDGIGLFSTRSFAASIYLPTVTNAAGTWTFRFYELIDNGGVAQVDATWNITVNFTDDPPTPPASTNLGALIAPGTAVATFQVPAPGYAFYRLTLDRAVLPALGRYLDIRTLSADTAPDSEIALFDANGTLVASDDDGGPGLLSQLSFGIGSRPAVGDGAPFDGRHGALAAGTYYLAVGKYDLQYPSGIPWGVTFQGVGTMNVSVELITNLQAGTDCSPPSIVQPPTSALASPGQSVQFTVEANGSVPLSYQWRRGGVDITNDSVISGATTPTLLLNGVREPDAGEYDVVVSNSCGTITTQPARLDVTCSADFNGDGDTGTDADIEAFFACLGGNCCDACGTADFDGDSDIGTDADIESFFRVLAGGPC